MTNLFRIYEFLFLSVSTIFTFDMVKINAVKRRKRADEAWKAAGTEMVFMASPVVVASFKRL
ncbi:hypothetical protein DV712_09770 [Parageobacillus thermoglucosidasius]|nr:hypothetical protein [Parageobacillus thermoglucosidasius]RDE20532.1 hypothetical protein DV712_09770 [Parageobacillus thermoglucosidasius]RDE29993.1 hypothetical protein DV714_03345 [Parageobacillus thermoglucosidasius]RDE35490.1 hypothetical protein DV713_03680 [Parageobacillus thermoglucosidasius]REK57014.1 MAG: hypothetical protein C6P36_07650 [Geobacillus sp.]